MRSRAVSLPFSCTLSTAASPTGCKVSSLRLRSSASLPAVVWMSISCSACASTEVSEVMAIDLSGPLNYDPHPAHARCPACPADRTFVPPAPAKVIFVTCRLVPTGSGSGGTSVESESTRLLRQWWNEPGDYSWVAEFLGPRGYLAGARVLIGTGGILMGLSLLCLMAEHLVEPAVVSHAVVVVMAVAAFAWAAYWWFLPWPPAAVSMILFAVTDVGIAVATAVHANPLGALSTTPLFAMTGAFIVFFFGPRVNAVHVVFATATIVATAVWLALSDQ